MGEGQRAKSEGRRAKGKEQRAKKKKYGGGGSTRSDCGTLGQLRFHAKALSKEKQKAQKFECYPLRLMSFFS